jgi:hypothetical protein
VVTTAAAIVVLCLRSRLCRSIHIHISSAPRLGRNDVYKWCLELVLYFLSLSCGGGYVCTNLSSILIYTKHRYDLEKKVGGVLERVATCAPSWTTTSKTGLPPTNL